MNTNIDMTNTNTKTNRNTNKNLNTNTNSNANTYSKTHNSDSKQRTARPTVPLGDTMTEKTTRTLTSKTKATQTATKDGNHNKNCDPERRSGRKNTGCGAGWVERGLWATSCGWVGAWAGGWEAHERNPCYFQHFGGFSPDSPLFTALRGLQG